MAKKKKSENGSYDVGYGKPPKDTQFKKGQSGNPSGKAKKAKTLAEVFEAEGQKKITINENGVKKTMTKNEVLAMSAYNEAYKGDNKAMKFVADNQPPKEIPEPTLTPGFSWEEEEKELLAAFEDDDNVDI